MDAESNERLKRIEKRVDAVLTLLVVGLACSFVVASTIPLLLMLKVVSIR